MKICPKNLILVKIVQSFDIADFHENLPEKIKFLLKSYKDM